MTRIDIIFVTWNSEACIGPCLESLFAHHASEDLAVYLIDNGSRDATMETVRRGFPAVHAVALNANTGFPKACNFGASLTQGEYLLFLNPDARIQNDVPGILANFLDETPDAGAAGPLILDQDGEAAPFAARHFPDLRLLFLRHFGFRALASHGSPAKVETFGDRGLSKNTAVPCLTGAALCISRSLFESIGGFPDDLPMYHEDLALCAAVGRAGKRCYYVPGARLEHIGGESSSLSPARLQLHQLENGQAPWLFFRNERSIFHAAAYSALIFCASLFRLTLVFVLFPIALFRSGLRNRFQRIFRESLFLLLWSLARKKAFARRFETVFDPMPSRAELDGIRLNPHRKGAAE